MAALPNNPTTLNSALQFGVAIAPGAFALGEAIFGLIQAKAQEHPEMTQDQIYALCAPLIYDIHHLNADTRATLAGLTKPSNPAAP